MQHLVWLLLKDLGVSLVTADEHTATEAASQRRTSSRTHSVDTLRGFVDLRYVMNVGS